jgi:predicted permease
MDVLRDQRGLPWLADLWQDTRHGIRLLRRSPTFAAAALVTLALGIGANTAIFSLLNVLILRDLPVRDPAHLVQFTWQYPGDPPLHVFSLQNYENFRDHNSVLSQIIGTAPFRFDSRAQTGPDTLSGECVTGNFFEALGLQPAIGRLLGPQDDRPDAGLAAVLSWAYWKAAFNLDPHAVGSRIVVKDVTATVDVIATVVGVADKTFEGLAVGYRPDVWIPASVITRKTQPGFMLMARLKEGASLQQARAEMRVLDRPRIEAFAARDPQWRQVVIDVQPARSGFSTPLHQQFEKPLRVVMAIVASLLLLSCINVGSVLLARGAAREREMAVRVSLGAGRLRIVRQVLTESLLLSIAGGLLGVASAYFSAGALLGILISGTRLIGPPPRLDVSLNTTVLAFTAAVTIGAAMLFGAVPAWTAFVSAPASALRTNTGTGQFPSRRRFGSGLVVAQIALSLALVSVSDLYIGHLSHLRDRSLGFDRNSVLLVSVDATRTASSPDQLIESKKELLRRFEAIPGVRSATLSGMTPISGAAGSRFVTVEGFVEPPEARRRFLLNDVAPRYFETFATPIIAGRDFQVTDERGPRVAIVNQAMVRHYFADRNPLGRHVVFDGDPRPYEIVAVVGDAKYADVRIAAPATIYLDSFQQSRMGSQFALRTSVPPRTLAGDVRRVVADVLKDAPGPKITTLAEQVDGAIIPERLVATLSGFLGGLAMLLAAIGLYGLLAYTVARRTNEIGVRMALGATAGDVARMVITNAFWLVCAGLIVGAPIALWTARIAASMVENLSATSCLPLLIAALSTVAVAVLASYVPTRRAVGVDPVIALRSE